MPQKKQKIAIIDGNALIHRGFHALPQNLRTTDGTLVNGVYGFATTVLNVMKNMNPEYFIATFDAGGKVFRHEKFPEYKAKRLKAPQELYDQIPIVHEFTEAMSIPIYMQKGYEADDLIGSLAARVKDMNKKKGTRIETYIITGDMDTLQLIDANTKVMKLHKGFSETEIYDEARVEQEYGFGPKYMTDYRGLKGDNSDNIPGVPGIGEKTAMKLIQHFKTLEALYKAVDKTADDGVLEAGDFKVKGNALAKLKAGRDSAFMSRDISKIVCEMPLSIDLKDSTLNDFDRDRVYKMFQKLQFKSLLKRLPEQTSVVEEKEKELAEAEKGKGKQASIFEAKKQTKVEIDYAKKAKDANYHVVATKKELEALVKKLSKVKEFALDTETSALSATNSDLVGISVAIKEKEAFYIPVGHIKDTDPQLPKDFVLKAMKPVLENPKIGKIGQNVKYDYVVFLNNGIDIQGISFDTLLAAYVLNPGERGLDLDSLAFTELGYEMMPITELIGTGKNQASFAEVPIEAATFYAAEDADIALRLKHIFEKRVDADKDTAKIFYELEVPMIPVLGHMENKGVLIDVPYLQKMSQQFTKKILKLSDSIFKTAGKRFNISSTQQLADILFNRLKLSTEGIARTKTGFSTKASELEKLRGKSKMVDALLEYRELTKLKNTYIDALPSLVHPKTKRIHTTYNQTIAATGRLSSIDPNLQNIPVRTETGNQIREAFYAAPGHSFVALDYSQIELRIMAHISGDETFVNAFKKGQDIHATVAAQIHGKKPEDISGEERREAKIINFAILYGAGARGLSAQTSMNYAQAKEYVEKYFEMHPKIRATIDRIKKQAHDDEYMQSLYGRKRLLPDINATFQMVSAAAERTAINMPFQGTNADIIKLAMLKLAKDMPEIEDMMILQVHDELIFEIPDKKAKTYAKKIQKVMEEIFPLNVPLSVNVEIGKRWGSLKEM